MGQLPFAHALPEGQPRVFQQHSTCGGINLSCRKGNLGGRITEFTASSFPCLLLPSETCLELYLHKKHYPFCRDAFSLPHAKPTLATLEHGVSVATDSVCSEMYSFPPSLPLPHLMSGRFTCFQFGPRDSQPGWLTKYQLIPSSSEFLHESLSGRAWCRNSQGSRAAGRALAWSPGSAQPLAPGTLITAWVRY